MVKKEDVEEARRAEGEGDGRREDARVVVESRAGGEKGMATEGRGGGREDPDPDPEPDRRGTTEESGRVGSTARVGDGGGEPRPSDDDSSSLGGIELK